MTSHRTPTPRWYRRTWICSAVMVATAGMIMPTSVAAAAAPPTISVGDVTVPEGNTGKASAKVTVRLSDPVASLTIVQFTTNEESATAGTDFKARDASVKIRAGRVSAVISIPVYGDTDAESDERLIVTLTDAGGIAIADGAGVVTIADDEGRVGLSLGDAEVWEGDTSKGPAKLLLVLDSPVPTDTFVSFTIADMTATAPDDFRARSGRVKIRAGRTTANISALTYGDTNDEPDELLAVVLTDAGVVPIADGNATVVIRNDEPSPVPAPITDLTVEAGPTARHLTATWTPPPSMSTIIGFDLEVTRAAMTNVVADVTSPFAFGCGNAVVTDTCIVRVRARNDSGAGPWSDTVTASTWAPPEAPLNLTLLTGGTAVDWDEPASERPIDFYEVQKQSVGSTSWTAVGTVTLTHAATTCIQCSVRVRGHSEVGFGAWSTVQILLPGTPTGLLAVRDGINHELVHIGWSPPTDPGSHPVTSYEIVTSGSPPVTVTATGADLFLRSTLNWNIQVYARNLVGRSLLPATVNLPAG